MNRLAAGNAAAHWLCDRPLRDGRQVLAADGKTVPSAGLGAGAAPALVAVYGHTHHLVLA